MDGLGAHFRSKEQMEEDDVVCEMVKCVDGNSLGNTMKIPSWNNAPI